MKRSQSDVTLSKSQEMSSTNLSYLVENSLEIEEDLQSTISTSSTSSNSSSSSKPISQNNNVQQPTPSFPIPKDRKQSSAANTPVLSSISERAKPKKTMSISNLDLSGKKYATISSGANVDLSPKKQNKIKSVSNFFKKSTSHNNLLDVNAPPGVNGEAGSCAESPSLNSSNSSISSTSSSANQKTLKSKIDSFFSLNKGNRSSLKYENSISTLESEGVAESDESDFDSSEDDDLPVHKKHSKRRQIKLFLYTQKSKNRDGSISVGGSGGGEEESSMVPLDLTAESASVPCTPKGPIPSPIGDGEEICNSSSINSERSTLTPSSFHHQKLERKSMSDPNIISLVEEETNSTNNNSNQADEEEQDVDDLRKFLERRLIRRPTVAELKLDNILFQTEFEDVAKEQTKTEIKNQKLFVGTRPSKKKFFNSPNPSNITNNSVNVTLKIEDDEESHKRILSKNLLDNEDEGDICRILILPCSGWRREVESEDYQCSINIKQSLCIEEIENEFPHYYESFCKDRHKNYLATNNEELGPVVISIKREAERTTSYKKLKKKKKEKENVAESCPNFSIYNYNNLNNPQAQQQILAQQQPPQPNSIESYERKFKTIIRTKEGEDRFFLSSGKSSPHELINTIKSIFLSNYPELQFQKIPNNSETRKMLQYWETAQMTKDYKFGLLYRKNGQTNENNFFSNTNESPEYKEFLEFIGEKVKLKGWENYKGGLDVKSDTTGLYSIYKTKEISINENKKFNVQIMFHVSTLLPLYPNDEQQLERKRHIGNDIVVIIFQDINCSPPFRPNMIKSEFNHVFVVIQPLEKSYPNEITKYSVSITYKEGVSSSTPFFHSQKIWKKDNVFLDHLLTKLINAEKASYYSPAFSDKMKRTRLTLLKNIVNTFQQSK
ncbi:hypothetical protein DICPUDRAFT_83973 [Dictyostelium purpureum]|uniref:Rap-GAP domain-containing protein n=1 Tax=Dictyostelium purpureum TaxID=5786 RepID=F1A176_DICPU|nr:uncharacterized protein DICPUDRAFT_83973 [Dictyostelium purpureum]EGC30055.1 hypothetical protein DICPUDRAFT_83973 [Dictyostelium purpureum]|eukprot:XP_003293418.1 hypothetical protein DICPUDRAFT_83973 [Dictyostelium purpureum]